MEGVHARCSDRHSDATTQSWPTKGHETDPEQQVQSPDHAQGAVQADTL